MPLHPAPAAAMGLAGLPSVARVVGDLLARLEHDR
jgi:alkylated DNA nucleotide flippase Atl1